jgi:hypothetical protein
LINDMVNGTGASAYLTSLTNVVNLCLGANCAVLIVIPPAISSSIVDMGTQQTYWEAIYGLQAGLSSTSNVVILDMNLRWPGGYNGSYPNYIFLGTGSGAGQIQNIMCMADKAIAVGNFLANL